MNDRRTMDHQPPTEKQRQVEALRALADSIIEAVKAAGPSGAPAGPLYAALMACGMTLDQFETIMNVLVRVGKLRKSGLLYFAA